MNDRKIIVVLGKTGHGKSVWTRAYVAGVPRLFVADPLGSFRCEWCDHGELLNRYDYGEFAANKKFSVGSVELADAELMGALAFLSRSCTYVVEEASLVFEKGGRLPGWANDIVFLGRHRDVSMIVTAQRAASIPIEIRSQAHRVVSFAQHEGDDLKWLRGFFGNDIEKLPSLPPLTCLDSEGTGARCYSLKPPERRDPPPEVSTY